MNANQRADDTSSSQGLSSPPSASPTQVNAPASDSLPFDTASKTATHEDYNNNTNEAAKIVGVAKGRRGNSGGGEATTTMVMTRKPRRKKEEPPNTNSGTTESATNENGATTTTFGVDGKMKKQRAARGTSLAFQKKMQKRAAEAEEKHAQDEAKLQKVADDYAAAKIEQGTDNSVFNYRPTFNVPPLTATTAAATHQSGNREAIQNPITNYTQNLPSTVQHAQRPASGQIYDPIRSSTIAPQPISPNNASLSTPTKPLKSSSASASPSISSLIDHPDMTRSRPHNLSAEQQQPRRSSHDRESLPPDPKRPRLTPPAPVASEFHSTRTSPPTNATVPNPTSHRPDAMDIDTDTSAVAAPHPPKKPSPNGTSTAVSTAPHSPKPARPTKEPSKPLPNSGSGLLSGTIFGTTSNANGDSGAASTAPTVVLDIPLTGESNQYINFTELAEKRYGFSALHPRLAAQRRRLADVAAMGAAIEKNASKSSGGLSTDDKSVDLSADEAADDSNVEMGGMLLPHLNGRSGAKSGEETGEGVKPQRKKRMMKEDMYDKEDDFVDDTELAWEEQAAVSKDGFFVYSGLLVPEGEEAKVERADGAPPKRGGRGGGRGSRGGGRGGGRGGSAAAAAAANKDSAAKDGKVPMRKSRTTKADKEKMEKEKSQRETLAPLASKPAGYVMGFPGLG